MLNARLCVLTRSCRNKKTPVFAGVLIIIVRMLQNLLFIFGDVTTLFFYECFRFAKAAACCIM